MGRALQILRIADIVLVDRRMIDRFGGLFVGDDNMANPGSLEHVLEEIQGSVFGNELFPGVLEKAAAIGWRIIAGHVFNDGNKRTGMEACRLFLRLNGLRMRVDRQVVRMTLDVAQGRVSLEEFTQWVADRTSKAD